MDDAALSGVEGFEADGPAGAGGAFGGGAGHRAESNLAAFAIAFHIENDAAALLGREGAVGNHGDEELEGGEGLAVAADEEAGLGFGAEVDGDAVVVVGDDLGLGVNLHELEDAGDEVGGCAAEVADGFGRQARGRRRRLRCGPGREGLVRAARGWGPGGRGGRRGRLQGDANARGAAEDAEEAAALMGEDFDVNLIAADTQSFKSGVYRLFDGTAGLIDGFHWLRLHTPPKTPGRAESVAFWVSVVSSSSDGA